MCVCVQLTDGLGASPGMLWFSCVSSLTLLAWATSQHADLSVVGLSTWQLASKKEKAEAASLLSPGLTNPGISFLLHSDKDRS